MSLSAGDIADALEDLESIRPLVEGLVAMTAGMAEHLDKRELGSALALVWALKTARGELQWSGTEVNHDTTIEILDGARDAVVSLLITMAAMRDNRNFEVGDWEDAAAVLRVVTLTMESLQGPQKREERATVDAQLSALGVRRG